MIHNKQNSSIRLTSSKAVVSAKPAFQLPALTWLLLGVLALSLLGNVGNLAAWAIVFLWALRGSGQAVESLLLSLVLVMLNPGIFSVNEIASTVRWGVLFVAAARVAIAWMRSKQPAPTWWPYFLLFVGYLLSTSFFVSTFPSLSISKALMFAIAGFTVYIGLMLSSRDWLANFTVFGLVITLTSLPLLALPAGYLKNGVGFQGIFVHPQSFGVILAFPFAAMAAHWILANKQPLKPQHFILLMVMTILMLASQARTGYLVASGAFMLTAIFSYAKWERASFAKLLFHPIPYFLIAVLILLIMIGVLDISSWISDYLFKRDVSAYAAYGIHLSADASILERLFVSRQSLILASWANFLNHPWFGIGFGVPSSLQIPSLAQSVGGVIVSAPTEKGLILTALLEEIGLIGSLFFLLLIWAQFRIILSGRHAAFLSLSFAAILVNFGEAIYFSAGGIGILVHIAIGVGLVAGEKRKAQIKNEPAAETASQSASISGRRRAWLTRRAKAQPTKKRL